MPFSDTERALAKSSPILGALPASAVDAFLDDRLDTQKVLSAEETFAMAGQSGTGLFLVVHGIVELFVADERGQEKVVDFVQAGHTLALETLLTTQPLPYSARALTDAAVLLLPNDMVAAWQDRFPLFATMLLSHIAQRVDYVSNDMLTLRTKKAPARLVCYLLCHFNKAPRTADGSYSLDVPFSRNKLASRLGITNSHLSRAIRDLQEHELIVPQGRGYFIPNVPALSKYVCPAGCDFGQDRTDPSCSDGQ